MATARVSIEALRQRGTWTAEAIEDHNRWLFAAQQRARRGPTPEVFFNKRLDNSRLVKKDDPVRKRELRSFFIAAVCLFVLCMGYSWQHFSSIEYGYHIESEKAQLRQLQDQNRELALTEAQLSSSERIDRMARQIGMGTPQPGQMLLPDNATVNPDMPVLASVSMPALHHGR